MGGNNRLTQQYLEMLINRQIADGVLTENPIDHIRSAKGMRISFKDGTDCYSVRDAILYLDELIRKNEAT